MNWDSYGAEPPSEEVIQRTQTALEILQEMNLIPTRVSPSAENGAGIIFISGDKYADIEFFNTGEILALRRNGDGNSHVWEVGSSREDLKQTIEKIVNYIIAIKRVRKKYGTNKSS